MKTPPHPNARVNRRRLAVWLLLWATLATGLWANVLATPGTARRLLGELRGERSPLGRASAAADELFRSQREVTTGAIFLEFVGFDPDDPNQCETAGLYYNKAVYWFTDNRVYIGPTPVINTGEDVLRAQAGFSLTPAYIETHGIQTIVRLEGRDGQFSVSTRYVGGGL